MLDTYPGMGSGRVILRGRPATVIHSVTIGGSLQDPGSYTLSNGYILQVDRSLTQPRSASGFDQYGSFGQMPWSRPNAVAPVGPSVAVDYTYGVLDPPLIAQRAISVFSAEIQLAESGSNDCRIPERVTSVTRQGVSWTMLDPQEFLSDGRTGIYEVDLAIRALNPGKAKARARLFSASFPPPMRRSQ